MIKCSSCGRENEPFYRFCLGCGQPLGPAPAPAEPEVPEATPLARLGVLGGGMSPPSGIALEPERTKSERLCGLCGHTIAPGFTFCGNCGARSQPTSPPPRGHLGDDAATRPLAIEAYLVQIRSDGQEGSRVPLNASGLQVGRAVGGPVFEGDPFLSPLHATFWPGPTGQVIVRDEGSLNGTFVRVRQPCSLLHGDVMRIGQELLRFERLDPTATLVHPDGTVELGSPANGAWGRLCLLQGPQLIGDGHLLRGDVVRIGREQGDIRFPEDGFVSGLHAQIRVRDGQVWLEDLGSSNGTFLRIKAETALNSGDFLLLGQQLFLLQTQ